TRHLLPELTGVAAVSALCGLRLIPLLRGAGPSCLSTDRLLTGPLPGRVLAATLIRLGVTAHRGHLLFEPAQPVLPALLHRPDQTATDTDHQDPAERRQDRDQDRRGDRSGHTDLVQRGDDADT